VPKVNKRKHVRDARIEALQLLGKWTSLAQGHVLVGGSCSCGFAGGNLQIVELEQQILDYLDGKYAAGGDGTVTQLLRARAGYEPGSSGSLGALLRSIGAQPADTDPGRWLSLLDDLKRTLESFDELHRAR
jgi:hypothetical protein